MAIYRIEPALERRDLNMLLLPVLLIAFLSIAASGRTRSGPGIASHSFAMTFINSGFLNATPTEYSLLDHGRAMEDVPKVRD